MEMTQTFAVDFFNRQTISALDDRVTICDKNIFKDVQFNYEYGELKSRVARGRLGDAGWTNLGWTLIGISIFCAVFLEIVFPNVFAEPLNRLIPVSVLLLSLVAFALRLIKHDTVWFLHKSDDNIAFAIRLNKPDHEQREQFIKYIQDKIHGIESASGSQ